MVGLKADYAAGYSRPITIWPQLPSEFIHLFINSANIC